jgi:hypothetical protein
MPNHVGRLIMLIQVQNKALDENMVGVSIPHE